MIIFNRLSSLLPPFYHPLVTADEKTGLKREKSSLCYQDFTNLCYQVKVKKNKGLSPLLPPLPTLCYQGSNTKIKNRIPVTTLVTERGGKPGNRELKLLKYMSIPLLPGGGGKGVS